MIKAQGEPGHGSKLFDGSAMERIQVRGQRGAGTTHTPRRQHYVVVMGVMCGGF